MNQFSVSISTKNILLDIGDTIVAINEPFETYTRRGLGFVHDLIQPNTISQSEFIDHLYNYRTEFRRLVKVDLIERSFREYLSEGLTQLNVQVDSAILEAAEVQFIQSELSVTTLMPDALNFLDRAKNAGCSIIAATNNFSAIHVHQLFELFDLNKYFTNIYISADLRSRKPAKMFLDNICNLANLKPGWHLMINQVAFQILHIDY